MMKDEQKWEGLDKQNIIEKYITFWKLFNFKNVANDPLNFFTNQITKHVHAKKNKKILFVSHGGWKYSILFSFYIFFICIKIKFLRSQNILESQRTNEIFWDLL